MTTAIPLPPQSVTTDGTRVYINSLSVEDQDLVGLVREAPDLPRVAATCASSSVPYCEQTRSTESYLRLLIKRLH